MIAIRMTACIMCACFLFQFGCQRSRYRLNADRDVHCILSEKTSLLPWRMPGGFSVYPDPASRWHDATCKDDPCLPVPSPELYAYPLHQMPKRDPSRFQVARRADNTNHGGDTESRTSDPPFDPNTPELDLLDSGASEPSVDEPGVLDPEDLEPATPGLNAPETNVPEPAAQPLEVETLWSDRVVPTAYGIDVSNQSSSHDNATVAPTPSWYPTRQSSSPNIDSQRVSSYFFASDDSALLNEPQVEETPENDASGEAFNGLGGDTSDAADGSAPGDDSDGGSDGEDQDNKSSQGGLEEVDSGDEDDIADEEFDVEAGPKRVPIPSNYWSSIPANCLRRMLEFESVVVEYRDSFEREPQSAELDSAPKLALEDIIDQAYLNSRDLQTQKEFLYRVALALTLERFQYCLKPSVGGNGSALNFRHNRFGGITQNTLGIPTSLQVDKMLLTGGDILAGFANDVVLTFNGPTGFAANVGSELFFNLSQSLLQRDVRLESLTQAERDVVYAARDFARFRRTLFVDLANQYYSLIRQFRQVEIDSQNYFTLVRQFNQGQAEFRAGLTSRIQLDQVEQQVITGRQRLLATCTNLDNALDDLKVRIGLPTEEPMNIDLTELFLLTLRDELAVNAELVQRVRSRLRTELRKESPARATLLSAGSVLIDRMRDSNELRGRLQEQTSESDELLGFGLRLQTEAAQLDVDDAIKELQAELKSATPSQPIVFQRRMDIVYERLEVIELQLERVEQKRGEQDRDENADNQPKAQFDLDSNELAEQLEDQTLEAERLAEKFLQLIADERLVDLPQLLKDSVELEEKTADFVRELDELLKDDSKERNVDQQLNDTVSDVNRLLKESESYVLSSQGGLVPIEINMDDAMMTALVRRFDLLNERGFLADDWRQIKYAGDDLRSVLNLQAGQSIRTRNNRPFDFTFDESTTSLGVQFDAPLNRRAQRNTYRNSLINYQAALRRLALLEDNIKLSVRRDLRALRLDREQYVNDIASAALAFERVVSTELELRLGIGSVAARDFLESQTAYIGSLSNVASRHIDYIVDRLELFLDLELLAVEDDGFWHQLYDEDVQPMPYYQFPRYARPAYGRLHPCLKYSPEIRRMECVPNGTAINHRPLDVSERPNAYADTNSSSGT